MSYFADRIRETSTTSGAVTTSSTITIAGAVAQYVAFSSRVITGDQCEVVVLDGGGTVWLNFIGTLTNTTTLTINTLIDGSAGRATGVTLTAGTHKVFIAPTAQSTNKFHRAADHFIDHVASGLIPPTSASLVAVTTAGVAYVGGERVVKAATSKTYTASKDTYVDLDNTGAYTYAEVANAAAAPSLTAASIRIAKVVSSGTAVTSVVTSGVDGTNGTGNPIGNKIRQPTLRVAITSGGTQSIASSTWTAFAYGSGTTVINNDGLHSEATNNTRCTIAHDGLYVVTASGKATLGTAADSMYVGIQKNGAAPTDYVQNFQAAGATDGQCTITAVMLLVATDYVEGAMYHTHATAVTLTITQLTVTRIS